MSTASYSALGIKQQDGKTIWLQSLWGFDGMNQYFYSTDGKTFTPVGTKTQLVWGSYRGDRSVILNYILTADTGLIDVDAFTYRYASEAGKQ